MRPKEFLSALTFMMASVVRTAAVLREAVKNYRLPLSDPDRSSLMRVVDDVCTHDAP